MRQPDLLLPPMFTFTRATYETGCPSPFSHFFLSFRLLLDQINQRINNMQCVVEDSYPQRVPTGVVEACSKNSIPATTEQIGKPIFSRPAQPLSKDPTMSGEPTKRSPPEPPMFARPKANPRQPCVTKIGQPLRNGHSLYILNDDDYDMGCAL